MEFFTIIEIKTSEEEIKKRITFDNLEDLCTSFFILELADQPHIKKIGGVWGDFSLQRDEIKGGVRFSLLDCPNALAYTLTTGYPPDREKIVMHLTINRMQKAREFMDELNEFMDDWKTGLEENFFE